jgi:hypothetical protein
VCSKLFADIDDDHCPIDCSEYKSELPVESVIIPDAAEICNKTAVQNCHACPNFNCGDNMVNKSNKDFYAAGRAKGVRECMEAVGKLRSQNIGSRERNRTIEKIIAALEGVKEKK